MNVAKKLVDKHTTIFIKDIISRKEMDNLKRRYICKYYSCKRGFCINNITWLQCPFSKSRNAGKSCTALFAKHAGYSRIKKREVLEKFNSKETYFKKDEQIQ